MIVKAVTLFLVAMAVLGMFGKLRFGLPKRKPRQTRLPKPTKCKSCGAINPGPGPCPCKSGSGDS